MNVVTLACFFILYSCTARAGKIKYVLMGLKVVCAEIFQAEFVKVLGCGCMNVTVQGFFPLGATVYVWVKGRSCERLKG